MFPQTHADWVSESAELAEVGDLDGAAEAEVRLQALEEAWLLYNTEHSSGRRPQKESAGELEAAVPHEVFAARR